MEKKLYNQYSGIKEIGYKIVRLRAFFEPIFDT